MSGETPYQQVLRAREEFLAKFTLTEDERALVLATETKILEAAAAAILAIAETHPTMDGPKIVAIGCSIALNSLAEGQRPRRRGPRLMIPHGVQLRRTGGWRKPAGTVVVSRPGRWGNLYRPRDRSLSATSACVDAFQFHLMFDDAGRELAISAERMLRGLNLACWCALDRPCHRNSLLLAAAGELWRDWKLVGESEIIRVTAADDRFVAAIFGRPERRCRKYWELIQPAANTPEPFGLFPGRSVIGFYPSRAEPPPSTLRKVSMRPTHRRPRESLGYGRVSRTTRRRYAMV